MLLLCDLPPLCDILDTIEPDEEDVCHHNIELYETILQLIDTYMEENPTEITEPDFEETLFEDLVELFEDNIEEEDELVIEYAIDQYFSTICPPRSHADTFIIHPVVDVERIQQQIDYLKTKPQPVQRTPEWYAFRRNLITASNAYKAFESTSSKNQLIYEKCKEDIIPEIVISEPKIICTTSSLHWGQKYEPVSVALYEHMFETQIGDFGCIQHEEYYFIGASPDGINVLPSSPRFGRMLEIKNVVSRVIDGIPKKEYWVQMQLQMETCNLDECDFLETQFKEYETHAEFVADDEAEYKGAIIQLTTEDGRLKYIHSPIAITVPQLEEWESKTIQKNNSCYWVCTHYWKTEKISCVLVERNRQWFCNNVDKLAELWNTVLEERISGYEHRAPNKKITIIEDEEVQCLFVAGEDGKIM